MRLTREYKPFDVLTAARKRIAAAFDAGPVQVAFSGGKDSGVLLHLAVEEARRRKTRVSGLFVDWEAQFQLTIDYVRACREMYADVLDLVWACVPLVTVNGCSMIEPEWTCWDPAKRDNWVRPLPEEATTSFPFMSGPMTFEDFMPAANANFEGTVLSGVRAQESHDRFLGVFSRARWGKTKVVCPLYDWKVDDIWGYFALTGAPYNRLYDRMYQAGLPLRQMRICEPYGETQRQGLWLFQIVEPETWAKVAGRVAGADTAGIYSKKGKWVIPAKPPNGHTWESFTRFLLDTCPAPTAEHYRTKIAVYLKWCRDHDEAVPDEAPDDLGAKDVPSWRRICTSILKNDYWMTRLSFAPTKTAAYAAYMERRKAQRESWQIL